MSKVKFTRVRVTAPLGVTVQASALLSLSAAQVETRRPWLVEVKGEGFKVASTIQLKRGEEFGIDDLRRLNRNGVELIDEPAVEPARKGKPAGKGKVDDDGKGKVDDDGKGKVDDDGKGKVDDDGLPTPPAS